MNVSLWKQIRSQLASSVPPGVLVAVSKGQSFEKIRELYELGQRDFGENYPQELEEKAKKARENGLEAIRWHFLGRIQTNKLKIILRECAVVHSVDSVAHAQAMSRGMDPSKTLSVFLQVNTSDSPTKGGFVWSEVPSVLQEVKTLSGLSLLGLMAIPDPGRGGVDFPKLRDLARSTQAWHAGQLSMGMSDDYEIALQNGATYLRIGSAIFGPRA